MSLPGAVGFSSENPLVSPGLLPLGLVWGEPGVEVQASMASVGIPQPSPPRSHVLWESWSQELHTDKEVFSFLGALINTD